MTFFVYIDGLSQPKNPGTGTYAFLVYDGDKRLKQGGGLAGREVTSNFAEYTALVEALKALKEMKVEGDVVVRSDSQLLVGQMGQAWKVKGGGYIEKLFEARELLREFGNVTFEWIPREKNQEADLITRVEYEKHAERS